MNKIDFLENDYQCPASDEDIRNAKRHLKYGGIPIEEIEKMEIHYQFGLKTKEEIMKLLFSKETIKATYSMYCQGSDSDFMFFTAAAGRNHVKDIVYIDSSGQLVEFLNRNLRDEKNAVQIACGINQNTFLTLVHEPQTCFKKIKIEFNDYFGDCVVLTDFDINTLINEPNTEN